MKKIFQHSIFQQLVFWLISFVILYRLFKREADSFWIDFYYTVLFCLPLFLIFYINYFLVKKYLLQKSRLMIYTMTTLVLILLGIGFHYVSFGILADYIFSGYYFVSVFTFWEVFEFITAFWLITLLVFISQNWFLLKDRELALAQENHQIKLASLKAQLNPHFLFNSLNNIYGISAPENKRAKSYLVKLSEALRYMIYDTTEDFVPLEKEILYIQNYIALEELRLENPSAIHLKVEGDFTGYLIAPLLLLPLVENCFKHFNREYPEMKISIKLQKPFLILKTENHKATENNASGGMGLQNLKNRLALIYPKKHKLEIKETENDYKTLLQINVFAEEMMNDG